VLSGNIDGTAVPRSIQIWKQKTCVSDGFVIPVINLVIRASSFTIRAWNFVIRPEKLPE
jgi:hypothetical protein